MLIKTCNVFVCIIFVKRIHNQLNPLLWTQGEHVAVHPPGGASGHSGNSHGSGHLDSDGWNWCVQPGCWADSGHQVQVGNIIFFPVFETLHITMLMLFNKSSLTFTVCSISCPVKPKSHCGVGREWWSSCWPTPSAASSPPLRSTSWTTDRSETQQHHCMTFCSSSHAGC